MDNASFPDVKDREIRMNLFLPDRRYKGSETANF
ncbi:hypothetical protein SAMN05216464_11032 [Mucilaginibacter pineti]|uniref:Uncharacterized protein n=1 Tax=Mucilaginibacter pineti TaxID=1391627 RepID=A0A1G7G965_9SPHI|nr:hypothetical protein SAMN05216464_11032 [Mucilaginibacter pineti]